MASLGALKRGMSVTMILLFGVLFILLMIVSLVINFGSIVLNLIFGLVLVLIFFLIQWGIGPSIVAWSTRLKYLKPGENRFLEQIVAELVQKADIPAPRLAVVENPTPNAFVFGRSQKSATLAVHTGLLTALNKGEIRAVVAHELGHLKHNDMVVMTIASVIPLLAFVLARAFLFTGATGGGRRNNAGAIILVAIASYVIYFVTQILVLRLSRMREFYADSYSAYVTGDPHNLSSALAKITYGLSLSQRQPSGARAFYIGDEVGSKAEIGIIMQKKSQYDLDGNGVLDEHELQLAMENEAKMNSWRRANSLFSTHPPTFRRILMLKEIEEEMRAGGGVPKNVYEHI